MAIAAILIFVSSSKPSPHSSVDSATKVSARSTPSKPTVERKKSAAKHAAILGGAMQEFLSNGYAATSMDRVAAAAGVSKATVYSHFQDKASLFGALVQQLAEDKFKATSFDPRDDSTMQGEPREVLTQLANEILDESACDPQVCEFMRLM